MVLTCPNWNWARTSFVVCCLHFGPVVVIQRVRPALSQPMDGCNTVCFLLVADDVLFGPKS